MDQDFTLLGPSGTKNNPVFNGDMKIIGGDAYIQVEDDGTGGTKVATVDDVVKPISIQLDTVTNTSGSYTHTTQTNYVVASMKPIQIECSNPSAFQDDITVTTANGSITLSCSSVSGTSDVTVTLMKSVLDGEADPEALNPSEFDVLAGRIGNLQSLATTEKSSVVGAVNEVNNKLEPKTITNTSEYIILDGTGVLHPTVIIKQVTNHLFNFYIECIFPLAVGKNVIGHTTSKIQTVFSGVGRIIDGTDQYMGTCMGIENGGEVRYFASHSGTAGNASGFFIA